MAFWNHKGDDGENWDNEENAAEYEKNFRSYADEYDTTGWGDVYEEKRNPEENPDEDYEDRYDIDPYAEEIPEVTPRRKGPPAGEEIPEEEAFEEETYEEESYEEESYEEESYGEETYEEETFEEETFEENPLEKTQIFEGSAMFDGEISYEEDPGYSEEGYEASYDGNYDANYDEQYEDTYEEERYDEDYEEVDYDSEDSLYEEDDRETGRGFLGMGALEKIMLALGFVAVFMVVVVGALFIGSRMKQTDPPAADPAEANTELAEVGKSLNGITTVGETGLLAALDARKAAIAALNVPEEPEEPEKPEYQEEELKNSVTVSVDGVSVLKDLKIRFLNTSSKKLIANVPFTLTVTDPDGKTISWSDDDQDGIIYHKKLTPGTYKIHVESLSGAKYADIKLPADLKLEVKGEIAYEKVEVAGEVKKASEVNEAKEDTGHEGAGEEEEKLSDTVAFVESTATPTYIEVRKSEVKDPMSIAMLGSFRRLASISTSGNDSGAIVLSPEAVTIPAGKSASVTATLTGISATGLSVVSSDPTVATATLSGTTITINGLNVGTATVSVSSSENAAATKTISVTVGAPGTLALSATSAKAYPGRSTILTVTLTNLTPESLAVASSDPAIATAAISGTTVTITGVAAGSANITVSSQDNPNAAQVCTVMVSGADNKLLDTDGKPLLVLQDGKYVEATYADYYNDSITVFYKAGLIKYTGWQTLDGVTYYYTADGKVVTGEQIILGVKYSFNSDGSLQGGTGVLGIDVSKWNGNIDWTKVANSGVKFAIIRVGYRGSTQGSLVDDAKFEANIKGATAAGLKVGVYFFTQAIDEVEAVYEASMVLDRIAGYQISYPVYLDVEASGGRADSLDVDTRTAICRTFCQTIANKGYATGIYANKTWLTSKIDVSKLGSYKIWLAQYATTPTYGGRYELWQYSSKGSISGIKGNVDLNLSYMGY